MKTWSLAILVMSSTAMATVPDEHMVCPSVTEDARLILTSIQTLRDQIRSLPECQSVTEKLNVINRVLANSKWKDVKEQITTTGTAALEGADVEEITQLTTEVSTSLADTISMLSGNASHCVPSENKASFLATVASITKEVSGIAGSVTGPYGQAVSLVGNLISTSIAGVDQLFKQNQLYAFHKPAEELLFMNQFCAFTQSQQEVRDFVEMEKKETELRGMRRYLIDTKIKDLVENCPECAAYKTAWDAKLEVDKVVTQIIADANIVELPRNNIPFTFTRCTEIHRAFHTSGSDLDRMIKMLQDYRNPMMSSSDVELIEEVTGATKGLKDFYPRYTECVRSDNQQISVRFNDFMRDDILKMVDTIFGQQLATFRYLANKKFRQPLGDFTANSLDRVKWALEEITRVARKVTEPNYQISKQMVMDQQADLRVRLVSRLMPSYLRYRFRSNRRDTRAFMRQFATFTKRELAYFNGKLPNKVTSIKELVAALKTNPELGRYFVSSYDRVFNESRVVLLQVVNNKRFCDYLLYSRSMTPENRTVCDARMAEMTELQKEFATFQEDLDSIMNFDRWADTNMSIQSTFVSDYSEHIASWNSQGAARWEVIQD